MPGKMFAIIEHTGMFGEFDFGKFPIDPTYRCDPNACSNGKRRGDLFGEWLPQGLGQDVNTWPGKITKALSRLWRIEELWKDYNGYSQGQYLLEEEQDLYLKQHPELEPGRKHSGTWRPNEPASPPASATALMFEMNKLNSSPGKSRKSFD